MFVLLSRSRSLGEAEWFAAAYGLIAGAVIVFTVRIVAVAAAAW